MVKVVNVQLDDIAGNRINIKNEYGYGSIFDMVETKIFLHIDSLICNANLESMKGNLFKANMDEFLLAKELDSNRSDAMSKCLKQNQGIIDAQPQLVKKLLQVQNLNMWATNTTGWNNCWAGWLRRHTLLTHDGPLTFNGYYEGLHIFRVRFNDEAPYWACAYQSIPIPGKWKKGDPLSVAIVDNFTDKPTEVKVYLQ